MALRHELITDVVTVASEFDEDSVSCAVPAGSDEIMKNCFTLRSLGLALMCVLGFTTWSSAQVFNGDFSLSLSNWTRVYPPGNIFPPDNGVTTIDIDGAGTLSSSTAYYAVAGSDAQVYLEQSVTVSAGVLYHFAADLAMVPPGNNADGGTVTAIFGGNQIAAFSFGSTTVGVNEYGNLSANITPVASGPQTLSIRFYRSYGAGGTPADFIDNISLIAVPEPTAGALVVISLLSLLVIHVWRRGHRHGSMTLGGKNQLGVR